MLIESGVTSLSGPGPFRVRCPVHFPAHNRIYHDVSISKCIRRWSSFWLRLTPFRCVYVGDPIFQTGRWREPGLCVAMRRGFWRLGLFLAAWAGQTAAQVSQTHTRIRREAFWAYIVTIATIMCRILQVTSLQADLKVQTVWQDVWGIVQIVFLPGGKVMTVHKTGELHVYESILSKNTVRALPCRARAPTQSLVMCWLEE